MATRTVRLDEDAEQALAKLQKMTRLSISEVLKRGLVAYEQLVSGEGHVKPYDLYARLDWCHVLALQPVLDESTARLAPGLTREQLLEAIHCLSRDGRLYRGARCIRFVGLRIPLLVPLALILWFPGVIWIAERIYAWVSRNRLLLSRVFGCKGACAVMPARKREQDTLV